MSKSCHPELCIYWLMKIPPYFGHSVWIAQNENMIQMLSRCCVMVRNFNPINTKNSDSKVITGEVRPFLSHERIWPKLWFLHWKLILYYFIVFQDQGLDFGLEVLPCTNPPGVKIFGSAPQFHAKNFSHTFYHGQDYEIPGE